MKRTKLAAVMLSGVMTLSLAAPAFAATYKVAAGDTLWHIAETQLGSGSKWSEIYEANKDSIKDPSLIYEGQEITIPDGKTPAAGTYTPGTYTGSGQGFGGTVTAEVTVSATGITSVKLTGANETAGIGGKALPTLEANAAAKGADMDGVAGATITSTAAKNAVTAALEKAKGTVETTAVADGTYRATAPGFSWLGQVTCDVTFKDGKLTAIDVVEEHELDTGELFYMVTGTYIPRLIENQTLAVDAVAGATASCGAVRTIVADAIEQAGGKLTDWSTPVAKSTETKTIEDYDVIVVGMGGSGILSFCAAADEGAKVIGLEKGGKLGGNSATTTGPMALNSQHLKDLYNNGEDYIDPDAVYNTWMEYVETDEKESVIRRAVYESGTTLDYYVDTFGFDFSGRGLLGSFAVKEWTKLWTAYAPDPVTGKNKLGPNKTYQFDRAVKTAIEMSPESQFMLETTVTEMITDAEGKVIGVKAVNVDGTTYEVYGKTVILATGGFIASEEMMLDTFGYTTNTLGCTLCTGDGIRLGQSVGGATYALDVLPMIHIEQVPNMIRNDDLTGEQKAILTALALDKTHKAVNVNGESFSRAADAAAECYVPGFRYYNVYTQAEIDALRTSGLTEAQTKNTSFFMGQGTLPSAGTPVTDIDTILSVGETYGNVISGGIADLAKGIGCDEATLTAALGEDGKYYAVCCAGYAYATVGGLDIDENMNVLKEDGTPIANVFAVGQDSEGVCNIGGKAYSPWGGQAQSWTFVSGRIAGTQAAKVAAGASAVSVSGTYTASAQGFGGEVTVTLTIKDNVLTAVDVEGKSETKDIGGRALNLMPGTMVAGNTVAVDGVSGATVTSTAILNAAKAALAKSGVTLKAQEAVITQHMTPGTYTGEAYGKWKKGSIEGERFGSPKIILPTKVEVTVSETEILDVKVVDCSDTPGFTDPCIERIPAAIVAQQSILVDTVTGATMTSQAILTGVTQALTEAGADLAGFSKAAPRSTATETYDVDLVIVGAGGAGTTAAIEAMEAGISTIVLEKTGKVGGTSVCSTGGAAIQSDLQIAAGVDSYTVDSAFKELMDFCKWRANAPLVYNILSASGAEVNKLQKYWTEGGNKGIIKANVTAHDTGKGTEKFDVLYEKFLQPAGVKLMLETTANELIMDGDKVVGVKAQKQDGTSVTVNAKYVLVATGGFGGNDEMMREYFGHDNFYLNGLATNVGDGLNMCLAAGAALSDEVSPHLAEFCSNKNIDFYAGYMKFMNQAGFLALDPSGQRFVNEEFFVTEALSYGASALRRVGFAYLVFTQDQLDAMTEKGLWGILEEDTIKSLKYRSRIVVPSYYTLQDEMAEALAAGEAWKADTLEELGKAIGFADQDIYMKNIADYQQVLATGEDPLFGKRPDMMPDLDNGPYYAVKVISAIDGTYNGIRVNENLQALNQDYQIIDGLYVAGQDSGGFFSYPYYQGVGWTQGYAWTSGAVAADHIIQQLGK